MNYANEMISNILIFRTDVQEDSDLKRLELILSRDRRIQAWNVDRDDVDRVLRIKSQGLCAEDVVKIIGHAGFFCEELTD
ncbi:hypothetical protein KK083_01505 [Fulvivirgaceae bacterium PWU4]|uniref:Uncharacterized protein n=1 Tax=Chryseosolibacter histidini TaxID=2782349 RepID=A0AAP2DIA8_9BACT|nr:hypothetical protein [Chryseosolibacter histidini]MBT1695532.1 hypothetical protein [Chryseosolibacter histidini]